MQPIATSAARIIDLPIDQTWDYVDDRLDLWFGTGDRVEILEEGQVGRRMRFHTTWNGRPAHIEVRVTAHDPPHRIVWVHEREFLGGKPAPALSKRTEITIELEDRGGTTEVHITGSSEPAGLASGVLFRLMGSRRAKRSFESSLGRLAALASGSGE